MDAILCYKTQMQLLEAADNHTALSPESQVHLRECAECRAYAQTLAMVSSSHIPATLDAETLARAKAVLPSQRRHHVWRWALCAAALAVICGLAVFVTQPPKGLPLPKTPEIVRAPTPPQDSIAEWDDLTFAASYAQADEALTRMDLELDILLAELD